MNIRLAQVVKKRHNQMCHETKSCQGDNYCEPTDESGQGENLKAVRITERNSNGESEQEPNEIELIEKTEPKADSNHNRLPELRFFAITKPKSKNDGLEEVH